MTIRYASINDLDAIAEIEKVSYPEAEGATREGIKERLKIFPTSFWVLEEENHIIGFINGMVTDERDLTDFMYDHSEVHKKDGLWQMIFSVAVSPEYRGKGYARKIMERVISDVKERKQAGIVLTCKEKLLPFYAQFGFHNEGISKSTHGDAVWYQMRLSI